MKKGVRLPVAALLLVVVLALSAVPAAAITGGELDGEDHPNVGLMMAEGDGDTRWRCSGTLIAPQVFLTAGHCVDGAETARVWFDSDLTEVTIHLVSWQGRERAV